MKRPVAVPPRRRARRAASYAAALLVLATAAGGCDRRTGTAATPATPPPAMLGARDVTRAVLADLADGIAVSGTLAPLVDIRITSPLAEVLEEVLVKEGEPVRRGQVLARFRTSALRPAAESAEALRRAAEADLERMKNLHAEGAIPLRDVESAEAAFRAADAERAASDKRLAETEVRAPVDGMIASRLVQAGDRAMEGDALFRLVNTRQLEFEASVPGESAPLVRPGARVILDVMGYAPGSIEGKVARVNATADPATRQVKIYVSVPNPEGTLVGDLFASGTVVLSDRRGVVAVPSGGIRSGEGGARFAWLITGGTIARRAITTGIADERHDLVEVTGGLAAGDSVVTGPVQELTEGRRVKVEGRAATGQDGGA